MKNIIKNQLGFTMAELMITVALVGIILSIGIPMIRPGLQNTQINTITNDLVSALMLARSESLRQNAPSCVCASDFTATPPACSGASQWETGWIAFSDFNGDCAINGANPNADVLLKAVDGASFGTEIRVRTNSASINSVNSVRFNGRGEPFANGTLQAGNFTINDSRPISGADATGNVRMAAAVILSPSGRARATRQQTQITHTP